jgi:hypothetical protein
MDDEHGQARSLARSRVDLPIGQAPIPQVPRHSPRPFLDVGQHGEHVLRPRRLRDEDLTQANRRACVVVANHLVGDAGRPTRSIRRFHNRGTL